MIHVGEVGCKDAHQIGLFQDHIQWVALVLAASNI
jgi:hypothetical protein